MQYLPEYLFAESPEIPGAGLIICTISPFAVFRLIKFDNMEDYQAFMNKHGRECLIPGYRMALQLYSTLHGDAGNVDLRHVINFYFEERIQKKLGYFKRYEIH